MGVVRDAANCASGGRALAPSESWEMQHLAVASGLDAVLHDPAERRLQPASKPSYPPNVSRSRWILAGLLLGLPAEAQQLQGLSQPQPSSGQRPIDATRAPRKAVPVPPERAGRETVRDNRVPSEGSIDVSKEVLTFNSEGGDLTVGPIRSNIEEPGSSIVPLVWSGEWGAGELELIGYLWRLRSARVLSESFGVIEGELQYGGIWLALVSLSQPDVRLTAHSYGVFPSPDGRRLVYITHYPRMGPVRQSVLGEIQLAEDGSAITHRPIHPPSNLMDESWRPDPTREWRMTSPVVWFGRDEFAFSQWTPAGNGLVRFSYPSNCLFARSTTTLNAEEFLIDPVMESPDGLFRDSPMIVQDLEQVVSGIVRLRPSSPLHWNPGASGMDIVLDRPVCLRPWKRESWGLKSRISR